MRLNDMTLAEKYRKYSRCQENKNFNLPRDLDIVCTMSIILKRTQLANIIFNTLCLAFSMAFIKRMKISFL